MTSVTLGGAERPIAFGFGALMRYEKSKGESVLKLFDAFQSNTAQFTDMVYLLLCGLENGARKSGTRDTFTIEQIGDWLDEEADPMGVIMQAMQTLADSFPQADDGAKKKEIANYPTGQTSTT